MSAATVYVIDDDEGSRNSIECLFNVHGIPTACFESGQQFLEQIQSPPVGCMVTDLSMPGMSGLDLYERTRELGWKLPAIVITAFGDVSTCVGAFKAGVIDYLEKPVPPEVLLERVKECLSVSERVRQAELSKIDAEKKLKSLTNKETEVLELLVSGQSMKNISAEFGTSFQAVSRHRQRILEKIGVEGDVSLARWVLDHRRPIEMNN